MYFAQTARYFILHHGFFPYTPDTEAGAASLEHRIWAVKENTVSLRRSKAREPAVDSMEAAPTIGARCPLIGAIRDELVSEAEGK
jgi:hypothetical protein